MSASEAGAQPLALLAASDKTGIGKLAAGLHALGWRLAATSGSARHIEKAGLQVALIEELTAEPEMFGGRVKTLHPVVFGGLLFRRGVAEDENLARSRGIPRIDLVACNFHPFVEAVTAGRLTPAEALDHIDVGGPSMVRAAAKNHPAVLPLVDPADYPLVLEALGVPGGLTPGYRRHLAVKAFRCTSAYDAAIADYLAAA